MRVFLNSDVSEAVVLISSGADNAYNVVLTIRDDEEEISISKRQFQIPEGFHLVSVPRDDEVIAARAGLRLLFEAISLFKFDPEIAKVVVEETRLFMLKVKLKPSVEDLQTYQHIESIAVAANRPGSEPTITEDILGVTTGDALRKLNGHSD